MRVIRIVLADDHDIVRAGLRALLEGAAAGMEVVGEARNGREAIACVEALAPDVVVMDVSMPVMDGAEATRWISQEHPGVRVVALTAHEDREHVGKLQAAGAAGYVVKRSATGELVDAIRTVASGGTYLDRHLNEHVPTSRGDGDASIGTRTGEVLTSEEAAVLRALAEGQSNARIADTLAIGAETVEAHRARIREKLGLRSRAEMIRYAVQQGWLPDR